MRKLAWYLVEVGLRPSALVQLAVSMLVEPVSISPEL